MEVLNKVVVVVVVVVIDDFTSHDYSGPLKIKYLEYIFTADQTVSCRKISVDTVLALQVLHASGRVNTKLYQLSTVQLCSFITKIGTEVSNGHEFQYCGRETQYD